jgi:hypothetical protein
MASSALLKQALSILQGEAKSCSRSGRHPQPSFRRRSESGGGASFPRRGSGGESLKRIPPQMHHVDEDCLARDETIFDSKCRKCHRQALPALFKEHHTEDLKVSFAPMTSPKMRSCKRVRDAVSEMVSLSSSRFGSKCLNSGNKALLFPRFEMEPVECLERMGPIHVGGKRMATRPPNLNTTEETRIHWPLILSLQTQRPQVPMSFEDPPTVRSIADPLDKSTPKRYRPPETNLAQEVCDDSSLSQ